MRTVTMRPRHRGTRARTFALLAAFMMVAALGTPALAAPIAACNVSTIIAQEPGCPNSTGPCSITKVYAIGDGCVLDFGSRAVTLATTGEIDIFSGAVDILAGSFTMAPAALIDGRGNQATAPRNMGGMLSITTTGDLMLQKGAAGAARIDVSGNNVGGAVSITAGGTVTINGRINADQLLPAGGGGSVRITAGGDIIGLVNSQITATGGTTSPGGGDLDLEAGHSLNIVGSVDTTGSDGGNIDISSGDDLIIDSATANGPGDAGSGGSVSLSAGTSLQIMTQLLVNGSGSTQGSGGGCGGFACVESDFGDITISGDILADGAAPDGGGGEIVFQSAGAISLGTGSAVSAKGLGNDGCGGEIDFCSDLNVSSAARIDVSGGAAGGCMEIDATTDANFFGSATGGQLTATGRAFGGFGGSITVEAGANGRGNLTISVPVDAGGGGCSVDLGCGSAGFTDLSGCNLTVTNTGRVDVRAPDGGQNRLTAREQLLINGTVTAATTNAAQGSDGSNLIEYPTRKPPTISANLVVPTPDLTARDTCMAVAQPNCLIPCPTCGNGVVEFPEGCDNNIGTPVGCDGCSSLCTVENCDDGSPSTIDSCDSRLGCRHLPAPTPTITTTPTITQTGTRTPTPTLTPTSPPATATRTPTPGICVGDCDGLNGVTIEEVQRTINIFLGTQSVTECLNADRDHINGVTIEEVQGAVNSFLSDLTSCPMVLP